MNLVNEDTIKIEVHEQTDHGHTNLLHTVVVEGEMSSGQADDLQDELHYHDDVIIAFAKIEPGDDIYGVTAEHYQFSFIARCDMTAWVKRFIANS